MRNGIRAPRVAEVIAERLRERIVSGELRDGDLLPKEEDLRREFPVGKPSMREALRILETEGLITVRRGNQGGAVVHRPTAADAAYTLALVMSGQGVTLAEVAEALRHVEPICASLCALREDRARLIVPDLQALHAASLAAVEDLVEVTKLSRAFHERLVALCGNRTLILLVGALEELWSAQEKSWAERTAELGAVPIAERHEALIVHEKIIDRISAGDATGVRVLVSEHLREVQEYPVPTGDRTIVDASALKP